MKKKLALSIISLDECFPKKGFSGGGHKVTKKLIEGLIESNLFDIDIFCKKASVKKMDGINSITVFNKKTFKQDLQNRLKAHEYDYVLSSDVLLPYANNLIHSNSSRFKSKNGKNILHRQILKIFNAKKIKSQENNLAYDKATFTVSESLKNDYVQSYKLDENKVFVCHPAVDGSLDFIAPSQNSQFVIGSIVGGGLNKGGYLLLSALKKIPQECNIKARVIFPKIKKSGIFKTAVKLLKLQDKVEILAKQADMDAYYKSIDCYVLPSLNEAFGLVVTEAAANSKPSLVSSTTGVRELIQDGENGFVFDREKNAVRNLAQKLNEVADIYFNNHEKFTQVAKKAHEIPATLDWKKFTDIIINNMVGEVQKQGGITIPQSL